MDLHGASTCVRLRSCVAKSKWLLCKHLISSQLRWPLHASRCKIRNSISSQLIRIASVESWLILIYVLYFKCSNFSMQWFAFFSHLCFSFPLRIFCSLLRAIAVQQFIAYTKVNAEKCRRWKTHLNSSSSEFNWSEQIHFIANIGRCKCCLLSLKYKHFWKRK